MEMIEVNILGQRYKLRSDEGETYIQDLANFVNEKIEEVRQTTKTAATQNLAILAAINIADDFFKNKREELQKSEELKERIRQILKSVRSAISTD